MPKKTSEVYASDASRWPRPFDFDLNGYCYPQLGPKTSEVSHGVTKKTSEVYASDASRWPRPFDFDLNGYCYP